MHDQADVRAAILEQLTLRLGARTTLPAHVEDDFHFLDSGVLDSFGLVEFLGDVEKKLGVTVDFAEVDPTMYMTLGGLVTTIAQFMPGAQD